MSLFKIGKKKKEKAKPSKKKDGVKKEQKVVEEKKPEFLGTEKISAKKGIIAPAVLDVPHVAEKTMILSEKNQYVFRVFPRANKNQIKKAVEEVYGVDVLAVRIIKKLGKKKRIGKTIGWSKGYKKAIIKIKEGQKIEIMPR